MRLKEQVERLTGIHGDWTEQEKKGIRISQSDVDKVSELTKAYDLNTVSDMTGISKTTIWRILHGRWNRGEKI